MDVHAYIFAASTSLTRSIPVNAIRLPCYCGSIRQASRVVTQMYDQALKPAGLKVTQFGILRLLAAYPGMTTGAMADALVMDSTTLTRTLKIIHDSGWIEVTPGEDRRERHWSITKAGEERVQEALPLWKKVQKEFAQMVSDVEMDVLTRTIFQLVQKATQ